MADGYDIGVSASQATSFANPQTSDAGTVFNFSSPGASGDWYDQTQTSVPTSTAVSTDKSPGASTTTPTGTSVSPDAGSGVVATATGTTGSLPNYVIIGGLLGLVYVAYLHFKK